MGGAEINSRLVAYCSDQAHSSVEKAGLVGLVKIRYIESDENLSLRGDKLTEAIDMDKSNGLIPFFVSSRGGSGPTRHAAMHCQNSKNLTHFLSEPKITIHLP